MAIELHDNLKILSNKPEIAFQYQDDASTPWASVAGAHNGVPEAYRAPGKIRFIDQGDGKGVIEYWYRGGIEMQNLVPRYENLESATAYVETLEGLKADTLSLKEEVIVLKDQAQNAAAGVIVGLGTINAATGIATIKETGATYTPTVVANQENGKYFDVVVAGTLAITGISIAMEIGGIVISRGTQWDYLPKRSTEALISKQTLNGEIEFILANGAPQENFSLGTTLVGSLTANSSGSDNAFFFNTLCKASEKGLIKKFWINVAAAGNIIYSIGDTEGTFFVRRVKSVALTCVAGYNEYVIADIPILAGETFGINGGTSFFKFSTTGLPSNRYIEKRITGAGGGSAALGSYISYGFEMVTDRDSAFESLATKTELAPLATKESLALTDAALSATNILVSGKLDGTALPAEIVNSINDTLPPQNLVIGVNTNVGGDGAFSSLNFNYNSLAIAAHDGIVTKISTSCQTTAGTKYFAIGTPTTNGFIIRKRLSVFNLVLGVNILTVNEPIFAGETVAINGGLARLRFRDGSNDYPNNRRTEASTTAIVGVAPLGSFVNLSYDMTHIPSNPLDVIISDKNFGAKSQSLADNGFEKEPTTLGFDTTTDGTLALSSVGYVGNNNPFLKTGRVDKITINIGTAGTLKLSLGNLDQFNYFLKAQDISKTVAVGVVSVDLDINVEEGQIILIDKSSTAVITTLAVVGNSYLNADAYDAILVPITGKHLSYNYTFTEIVPSPFATTPEYQALLAKTNSLETLVDSFRPKQRSEELIIMGNSLVEHVIETVTVGWWGLYGMAASERAKDLAHVLLERMKIYSPGIVMRVRRTNDWEGAVSNNTAFTYSNFNTVLGDPALRKTIVIRLLDNVKNNLDLLEGRCIEYLTYVRNYCTNPETKIIVTGSWYTSAAKDLAMKNACDLLGITFIPISSLNISANQSKVGNYVMGDDGELHQIFNSGVATHPGDKGHLLIAENIYAQAKYRVVS